jgi:secreted Zn-dependent insulinase-like peptidase
MIKNSSHILRCQFPDERIIQLPTGKDVLVQMKEINNENANSAIEMIYQIGTNVDEMNALLSVFCQIVESPFYEKLRTVEQIGYLVFSRPRYDHNVISFSIIIQSSDKDPIYIQHKCEEFFDSFLNEIKEMKKEDFNQHVKSCIEKNKEKDKQLGEETTRF